MSTNPSSADPARSSTQTARPDESNESSAITSQPSSASHAEVFATAAHDLRNPLAVILSLSELILNDPTLGHDEIHQFIEGIRNNADEMCDLLNDVQELARYDTGRASLSRVDAAIEALLSEAAEEANARVTAVEIIHGAERWSLDVDRMRRALVEILADAASRASSGVVARAEVTRGDLRITVTDDGVSPAADALREIAEGYRRGRRRRTTTHRTALGPAVAARIVEAHGGTVDVERGDPNGARIVVRIPADPLT